MQTFITDAALFLEMMLFRRNFDVDDWNLEGQEEREGNVRWLVLEVGGESSEDR